MKPRKQNSHHITSLTDDCICHHKIGKRFLIRHKATFGTKNKLELKSQLARDTENLSLNSKGISFIGEKLLIDVII